MLIKLHLIKTISVRLVKSAFLSLFVFLSCVQAETYHDAKHLEYWLKTLKDNSFVLLQKNAARQLGIMGDLRAKVELEYQAINHPSPEVRGEALYALGYMGSANSEAMLQRAINRETDVEAQKQARRALDLLKKRQEYVLELKDKLE